jgi:hypothetical protein
MDDQLARVERNLEEMQRGIGDFRTEMIQKLDQSFRWSIITLVVSLAITWLGLFLLLSRGAAMLRRLTPG